MSDVKCFVSLFNNFSVFKEIKTNCFVLTLFFLSLRSGLDGSGPGSGPGESMADLSFCQSDTN